MSASDGWQYQGRQGHGWFGNGTKPQEVAAVRRHSFRPSFRWGGSRIVQAQLSVSTAPLIPLAPLPVPNPDMGGPANERARRRWQYAAEEIRRGEYTAAIGHLFLGAAFPAEVDDPTPGPMDNLPTRAPGKPTEEDGFIPKKNWDGQVVPAPNGRGYGYPDRNGDVWVPTGETGHGGPHWDVQDRKGGRRNIMKGGKERK